MHLLVTVIVEEVIINIMSRTWAKAGRTWMNAYSVPRLYHTMSVKVGQVRVGFFLSDIKTSKMDVQRKDMIVNSVVINSVSSMVGKIGSSLEIERTRAETSTDAKIPLKVKLLTLVVRDGSGGNGRRHV